MSGSYDRPSRPASPQLSDLVPFEPTGGTAARSPSRGPGPADLDRPDYGRDYDPPADFDADPVTAPHRPAQPSAAPDLYADARNESTTGRRKRDAQPTPIVPAGSVTGRSLTLVIAIMCFLACLTSGAVYMMNQNATAWLRDIASEITVQVEPRDKLDTDKTIKEIVQLLQQNRGIRSAKAMSIEASTGLLEPWLGRVDALKSLPVPRLIAIEIDQSAAPDLDALKQLLERQYKGVTLDDHRQWTRQIRTVTRSFALGGLAILLLVGAATTAIIVSATRSALASNRDIVEVLHFVGATDRFIAGEFQSHFLRLGVRAGGVGAAAAMAVFFLMPIAMDVLGGGTMTMAEFRRFIGSGSLDLAGYLVLAGVVVVIAALCWITSRVGVFRILHSRQ